MENTWHILRVQVANTDIDSAYSAIYLLGGVGSEETAAPDINTSFISAYFDCKEISADDLLSRAKSELQKFGVVPISDLTVSTEDLSDWKDSWRQWFEPFEIVPNIMIAPTWKSDGIDPDNAIIMDPKMAFGTGLHGTTKLCAEQIYKLSKTHIGRSLVDVGSGSGILAMLARKLNFAPVCAVENDPDALAVARENFIFNKTPDITSFPDVSEVNGAFDVVVANILLHTVIELKDHLLRLGTPSASFILSGITNDQERELIANFSDVCELLGKSQNGEWSALLMKRK